MITGTVMILNSVMSLGFRAPGRRLDLSQMTLTRADEEEKEVMSVPEDDRQAEATDQPIACLTEVPPALATPPEATQPNEENKPPQCPPASAFAPEPPSDGLISIQISCSNSERGVDELAGQLSLDEDMPWENRECNAPIHHYMPLVELSPARIRRSRSRRS